MIRNLLLIGCLLVAAFMAGWFQIHREGDETTIRINRAEIRQDTQRVIEKGRNLLDRDNQNQSPTDGQDGYGEQDGYANPDLYGGNRSNDSYGDSYSDPRYSNDPYQGSGYQNAGNNYQDNRYQR